MALCDCGRDSTRVRVHFENADGRPLPQAVTVCPGCRPQDFGERFIDPSERRFYGNWEVNPNEYDTLLYDDGERVPKIKDWAQGEFERKVAEGEEAKREEAEAIERKRAFARERNKRPLTQEQIQKRVNFFKDEFAQAEKIASAQEAGIWVP